MSGRYHAVLAALILLLCRNALADDIAATTTSDQPQIWNFHFQTTEVVQGDPAFSAQYSGPNSLTNTGEVKEAASFDLFAGLRLWDGAELHVDGFVWQGFGLTNSLGIDDFPNAAAAKAGTYTPDFSFTRLFIRQTINLGGDQEDVPDDQLTLASKRDISRITFTL